MNYGESIQEIIDVIKADKSIVQPWRNKAISHLLDAQAVVDEGKHTTYRQPEELVCTCPEGGIKRGCPLHGAKA